MEETAQQWEREVPTFGRAQAYEQFVACASWPVPPDGRYEGPWNPPADSPILVLSIEHDGLTPPAFADRMADRLDGRIVRVDTFGHGTLGVSECADDAVTAYLTDLQVPDGDVTECAPNADPWPV